jgi:hypothetical protein
MLLYFNKILKENNPGGLFNTKFFCFSTKFLNSTRWKQLKIAVNCSNYLAAKQFA